MLKEGFSKDLITSFFPQSDGRLYDGGFLQDIFPSMELDRGDPARQERLLELGNALNDPDDAARLQRTQAAVDLDAYLRYLVLENILAHWDGYSHNANNYRLYENPATGKFHFFLHGMDQTWGGADLYWAPGASVGSVLWSSATNRNKFTTHLRQITADCIKPYNWNQRALNLSTALRNALLPIDANLATSYSEWADSGRNEIVGRLTSVLNEVLPGSSFGNASPAPLPPPPPSEQASSVTKYHLVEAIAFDHDAPWPKTSGDLSLVRIQEGAFGDDPANWAAAPVQLGNIRLIPLSVQSADTSMGDVSPSLRGITRHKPGTKLLLAATARPGMLFSGWTGNRVSQLNPIPLTLSEPLELTAHFIPLPFLKGTFAGRIQNGAGSWTLTLSQTGAFSGQIVVSGRKLAFRGILDSLGRAVVPLDKGRIQLELAQDLGPGSGGALFGTLLGSDLDASLAGQPLPGFSKTQPCPLAGQHNLVLRPPDAPLLSARPAGTSHALITISTTGSARISGSLSDGIPFLLSAPVSAALSIPVGTWLSKRRDTLSGDLTFSQTNPETLSGSLLWQRPADTSSKNLPWKQGFSLSLDAQGCRWIPPQKGAWILPVLGHSTATLFFSGPITNLSTTLQFSAAHKATEAPAPQLAVSFSVDPKTGFFTGKFRPSNSTPTVVRSFRGVFLLNPACADGYFLDTQSPESSGRVHLSLDPAP